MMAREAQLCQLLTDELQSRTWEIDKEGRYTWEGPNAWVHQWCIGNSGIPCTGMGYKECIVFDGLRLYVLYFNLSFLLGSDIIQTGSMNNWNLSERKLKRQKEHRTQVRKTLSQAQTCEDELCLLVLRDILTFLLQSILPRKTLFLTRSFESGLLIATSHQAFPHVHTGSLVVTVLSVLLCLHNKEPCFFDGENKGVQTQKCNSLVILLSLWMNGSAVAPFIITHCFIKMIRVDWRQSNQYRQ